MKFGGLLTIPLLEVAGLLTAEGDFEVQGAKKGVKMEEKRVELTVFSVTEELFEATAALIMANCLSKFICTC